MSDLLNYLVFAANIIIEFFLKGALNVIDIPWRKIVCHSSTIFAIWSGNTYD
jgi:hypothetical protein